MLTERCAQKDVNRKMWSERYDQKDVIIKIWSENVLRKLKKKNRFGKS